MRKLCIVLSLALIATIGGFTHESWTAPRAVDLKSADGTRLKGSYFAAAKPGPGAILYHQSNRTRESWASVAAQLAAAGINVLTVDSRGHGQSGGKSDKGRRDDVDAAFQFLISQPGVNREVIGMGGAGSLGVENATETARRHPQQVKSLVLLSGEAFRPQDQFLHQATQLPGLYVFSDEDEYPPTEEAMQLMYANAASPAKKLVHYSAVEEAPWLWYETSDASRVQAHGGHGTDLFQPHPELPGIIVHWFVTTLLKTPGHAPADPIAAAPILNDVEFDAGAARAEQKLREARQKDPQAQLWPEISMDIVGLHFLREGEVKSAIAVLKLNLLAYPDSADATENLAEAYLAAGDKVQARQAAQKSIEMLDSRKAPASTWTDTEQYRGEIREGARKVLKQVDAPAMPTSDRSPGSTFRDCPDFPEMVVIPAGAFTMGSSASEKTWVVTNGGNAESVADEAPQHKVSLRSFALGKYDVTRREYAAFVSETGYRSNSGCYDNGGPNSPKVAGASWKNPGFKQTDNDPVICVSWDDAQAYVSWLNRKLQRSGSASGEGLYRLPTESEWEYAARAGTTTRFWWGDDETAAGAHAWYKENSGGQTHRVGLKPANRFGLHDMAGNVWQWTQDCYAESYAAAPNNGTAAEMGNQCLRVDRGGSWYYATWLLRSATRERNPADYRDRVMGLRVARKLP